MWRAAGISQASESHFRDEFAVDCPLQRGVMQTIGPSRPASEPPPSVTALRRFAHKGLKGIVGAGTKSQCAELAGKPPAQAGHGQARKGTGSDPRRASRSSMPVPGFRSCTMQKKRFVGPIRLPSYAIPLTVLIRNEPCDIADRLEIALPLCLKLGLQIVGASGERRVGGNIRVPFREQLCESLLNTSSCRLLTYT